MFGRQSSVAKLTGEMWINIWQIDSLNTSQVSLTSLLAAERF